MHAVLQQEHILLKILIVLWGVLERAEWVPSWSKAQGMASCCGQVYGYKLVQRYGIYLPGHVTKRSPVPVLFKFRLGIALTDCIIYLFGAKTVERTASNAAQINTAGSGAARQ